MSVEYRLLVVVFALGTSACSSEEAGADANTIQQPASCAGSTVDVGIEVGERLPAIPVLNCEEEELSLRQIVCGHPLTLLDVGSASFRRCVEATDVYVADASFIELQRLGLNIVQVFTDDSNLSPASPAFCREYVDTHEIAFEFLIDPLGNTDGLSPVHPLNLVLNEQGVIVERWVGTIPEDRVERLRARLENLQ